MADKPFIYLIQSASGMPYPELADPAVDSLLLTWREPASDPDALFLPDSSWNEGRNRLYLEALRRVEQTGNDYLYYIFLDDDCEVREDRGLAEALGIPLTGNPFRTFERFLLEWEPAVGYTRYDWQYVVPGQGVNLGYNFDGLFNAYHREATSFLLPYYTGFDAESWLYSQHIINHLAALLYNPYRVQCNWVRTENRNRKGYRQRKKYWQIPTTFLRTALRTPMAERMRTDRPNAPEPIGDEQPRKKDRTYRLDAEFIARHFDTGHPLIRYRNLECLQASAPIRLPERPRTAVCMSGRCLGLDRTVENLFANLLRPLGTYDLFLYTPDDAFSRLADLLKPTILAVASDKPQDEGSLVHGKNCLLKAGVQAYLQQLHGLERSNALRLAHEAQTGVRYDCVIRCRPDLCFEAPIPDIRDLDLRYVHVPDFHQYEGVNDRFAVGNPENMTIYMSKYSDFHRYVMAWRLAGPEAPPVTAEMFTAGHLRCHGIDMRLIAARFNRVRIQKVKNDTDRR